MSTVARLSYVRRFLHFDHATSCLDGKIWIFWLQGYSLSFEEFAEQVVHMSCTLLSGDVVTLSAIYANCTRVGRRPLWHAMEHISTNVSGPWLLAGDFNIISFADERSGGSHVNMGAMGDFNLAIFNCSLGDVEFDGPPFTWTYGRVWQRLDRALMNQQWSSVFGITKASHMPRGRSNRAPLLIKCGNQSTFPTSFQFLNIWR